MFSWQIDSSRWLREGIESNHDYFWVWAPLKVILSFSATRPKKMANIYLAVPFQKSDNWLLNWCGQANVCCLPSILPDLVREQFCTQGIILWSMGTILWSITCFFRFSRLFNSLKTQVFWELPLTKIKLLINQTEIFL